MGILGLAQPLALSTPLTTAQLPFPLFVNGNEISQGVSGADALTYRLSDPGFAGPQLLTFTIHDHTLAVVPWITGQQPVLWSDAVAGRYLFQGYVKDVRLRPVAAWVDIDVTCSHISEALDFAIPIQTWDAGAHGGSDQAQIQSLIANFDQLGSLGSGGFIQVLNGAMPASSPTDRTTLRNAIDQVLAATGVQGAVAYVDNLGYLHTMAIGDVTAPYNISDVPNFSTTVPAAVVITDQGASDVDALWVYGATGLGSGAVYAWQCGITTPPRSPLRWAVLDAPQATTRAGAVQAATVEFQRRQNAITTQLVVTGYDGWAKGQLVTVTNAALGWSARQLTISAVDMSVIAGNGKRRYTITAGSDPVLFTARLKYMQAQWKSVAASGTALRGKLGGS